MKWHKVQIEKCCTIMFSIFLSMLKNIPICLQNIHASIKPHFSSEISSEKLKNIHVQE